MPPVFSIDNIIVIISGRAFQQTVGILLSTNCARRLANIIYIAEGDIEPG